MVATPLDVADQVAQVRTTGRLPGRVGVGAATATVAMDAVGRPVRETTPPATLAAKRRVRAGDVPRAAPIGVVDVPRPEAAPRLLEDATVGAVVAALHKPGFAGPRPNAARGPLVAVRSTAVPTRLIAVRRQVRTEVKAVPRCAGAVAPVPRLAAEVPPRTDRLLTPAAQVVGPEVPRGGPPPTAPGGGLVPAALMAVLARAPDCLGVRPTSQSRAARGRGSGKSGVQNVG